MGVYGRGCYADAGLTVTCSIFTLAALSIDHYFTVKAPTRRSQQLDSGQRGAIITLVVIWVVSALLVGPILLVRHVHHVDLSIDQVSSIIPVLMHRQDSSRSRFT